MSFWKRCLFLLFPSILLGNSTIVHGVDVLTGHFQYLIADHTVKGAKSLSIIRKPYLLDNHWHKNEDDLSRFMEINGVFPHLHLYLRMTDDLKYYAMIVESNRGITCYRTKKHRKNEVHMEYGCVKKRSQYIILKDKEGKRSFLTGYRNNPKNNKITFYRNEKKATVRLSDGSVRYYVKNGRGRTLGYKIHGLFWKLGFRYRLEKEVSANGEVTVFEYGDNCVTIKKIGAASNIVMSWIRVYLKDNTRRVQIGHKKQKNDIFYEKDLMVETSDGKQLVYSAYKRYEEYFPESVEDLAGGPKKIIDYKKTTYYDMAHSTLKCNT